MEQRSEQALPGISAAAAAAAAGRPGRRTLLRAGLLAGAGAAIGGLASAAFPGTAQAATGQQFSWAFCVNCKGLYYSGRDISVCPATLNPHSGYSYNYGLLDGYASSSNLQTGWKYCGHCGALFYGPDGINGFCPGNALPDGETESHMVVSGVGSFVYDLVHGSSGFQVNWAWCKNCDGLFYAPDEAASWCPINWTRAPPHNGSGSYNYGLSYS